MNIFSRKQKLRYLYATCILLATALGAGPTLARVPSVERSQIETLPAGLAPALARALKDELPTSYHLTKTEAGFETANSAHAMQYTFGAEGLQVKNLAGTWTWGLKLTGWGYVDAVQPLNQGRPVAQKTRLEYQYGSALTEWYLNTSWGLEQGFTLQSPPETTQANHSSEIAVEMALSGTLQPQLAGSTTLLLNDPVKGHSLARYTGLQAFDAEGRVLPAEMRLAGCEQDLAGGACRLQLVVDTSHAVYPLTIDPWLQQGKLTASDGAASDNFGHAVAMSGDTVVVGAKGDDSSKGSVYVFVKPGGGWADTSTFNAKLTASDGAASDNFGNAVAISGDTVVVGAYGDDSYKGSAYVFVKPDTGWTDTSTFNAKLTASDGETYDYFGDGVAISGDTVVVGARGDDDKGSVSGSAYVFVKPDTGWADTSTFNAKLTTSDAASTEFSRHAVAISGDTVVVGARGDNSYKGSAYVFVKPDSGWATTSTFNAKLTANDGEASDYFGYAVALSGDTVVVGASGDDSNKGSAYVFVKPDTGWTTTNAFDAKLTATNRANFDRFGYAVALSGDTVVVGEFGDNSSKGSTYVFVKPDGGWATTNAFDAKLTASDGAASDSFGYAVAISGDTMVVGASGDDSRKGSAYIFLSPPPSTIEDAEDGDVSNWTAESISDNTSAVSITTDNSDNVLSLSGTDKHLHHFKLALDTPNSFFFLSYTYSPLTKKVTN
jgi:uncharacterized protein (DUF2345 family)